MTTAWSHLPNAVHIDRVLESVKAHPVKWSLVWHAALVAAQDKVWSAAWYAAPLEARLAAPKPAGVAVRGAIAALIAWDDSAKYLDMSSDRLRVWGELSEDPACVLLLPAVMALERIKELEVA